MNFAGRCRLAQVAVTLLTIAVVARAATENYDYDPLGRLVRFTDSSGGVTEYVYDPAGNIREVKKSTTIATLAITSFSPSAGPLGSSVVIKGSGFKPQPGATIVQFGTASASVTSITNSVIVATVPSGATTAPISVKVGAATKSTATNFTVTTPPVIAGISPSIALPGMQVTRFSVTGVNLQGASFAFSPALGAPDGVSVTSTQVAANGTSATLVLNIGARAMGGFTLVATTPKGVSDNDTSPNNTLAVLALKPADDYDNDGLTNEQEALLGTNLFVIDTDGDGYADSVEVGLSSNPLAKSSVPALQTLNEALSRPFALLNSANPTGAPANEAISRPFIIKNGP